MEVSVETLAVRASSFALRASNSMMSLAKSDDPKLGGAALAAAAAMAVALVPLALMLVLLAVSV